MMPHHAPLHALPADAAALQTALNHLADVADSATVHATLDALTLLAGLHSRRRTRAALAALEDAGLVEAPTAWTLRARGGAR